MNEQATDTSGAATTLLFSTTFASGFATILKGANLEIDTTSGTGQQKRNKAKPLATVFQWAVKVFNDSGRFGHFDPGGTVFGLAGLDPTGLPTEIRICGKARSYMLWRAFRFALRGLDGGKITPTGLAAGLASLGHDPAVILYKPGRVVGVHGAKPAWPSQVANFVRYVLPKPDGEYVYGGLSILTPKMKFDLGDNDVSIIFYQVFWGLVAGADDVPERVVRIDPAKPLPYPEDNRYQKLVMILEKTARAKALLQQLRSRVKQNIADFGDPAKYARDPAYEVVSARFKDRIKEKTEAIRVAKEQVNRLVMELSDIIQERDIQMHRLDPSAPIKPFDAQAAARAEGLAFNVADLDRETVTGAGTSGATAAIAELSFSIDEAGF